jgi:hypothetical protein
MPRPSSQVLSLLKTVRRSRIVSRPQDDGHVHPARNGYAQVSAHTDKRGTDMLLEFGIKKALDAAWSASTVLLRRASAKWTNGPIDAEKALALHLQAVSQWSREVSFAELRSPKDLGDVFVEPDFFVSPLRTRLARMEHASYRCGTCSMTARALMWYCLDTLERARQHP